jgi:hypothetical protein
LETSNLYFKLQIFREEELQTIKVWFGMGRAGIQFSAADWSDKREGKRGKTILVISFFGTG